MLRLGNTRFDKARFEALTKLLRLRYHGQVEAPTSFDESPLDATAKSDYVFSDSDSVKAATLASFETATLRRAFLDRLAELVANEKGGRHVAATLMVTNHDGTSVFVAKNSKFRPRDEKFMAQTETLLRLIAKGAAEDSSDREALWIALLDHHETRIQDYISDLRQLLKQYMQNDDATIPSQSLLVSSLRDLYDAVFAQYPCTTKRSEVLVVQAHRIYKAFPTEDFSALPFSRSQNLRTALGFLGRLQTSFSVLVDAAERLPGFENIRIVVTDSPNAGKKTQQKAKMAPPEGQRWSLVRLFDHIGHAFTDDEVKTLLSPGRKKSPWNKSKLAQEFDKLKSSTWEVHAEMQLIPLYIKALAGSSSAYEYIGCSKKSCFLCWHFLDIFAEAKTRGCHGKLYTLWGLPDFQGIPAAQMENIGRSLEGLEDLVRRELLNPGGVVPPHVKESTLGPSTISAVIPATYNPSMVSKISEYLQNQRANLLLPVSRAKEPLYEEEIAKVVTEQSRVDVAPVAGCCQNFDCEKTTARRCSHCSGAWFCSTLCEDEAIDSHLFSCNRRPITSADLLAEDCFWDRCPEDPQVREDYGFQRCRNRAEETNLFGLYIGVFKYHGVTSEEVHRWRTGGILAEKIIELFSEMPEDCRGGYYPWFLRHRYVLDRKAKAPARDEDDVHKYIQELYSEAREYLHSADHDKAIEDLDPFAKQYCFFFLAMLLDSKHPPPVMKHFDLWFDFGYAVCSDVHAESSLSNLYQQLLFGTKMARDHFRRLGMEQDHLGRLGMEHLAARDRPVCTFDEFWKAWETGSLMELFERYDVWRANEHPSLREFLAYPGKSPRPSVWRLRHFLAIQNANVLTTAPETAAAAIEYGFHPQLDVGTKLDLHRFYVELFQGGVPPRVVHEAKQRRALHTIVSSYGCVNVSEQVKQVLRRVDYNAGTQIGALSGSDYQEPEGESEGAQSGESEEQATRGGCVAM